MMRVTQQPAYVLHRHAHGEASWLLELFSRDFGRVAVVAKSARRAKPGYRALLNPFQPLLLDWTGKGELMTLVRADTDTAAFALVGEALFCGFYVNELMLRLLHRHDPHETLFPVYRAALAGLADGVNVEATLRVFEKRLLQAVGYGLVLDCDAADGEAIDVRRTYIYVPERGPIAAEPAGRLDGVRIEGRTLHALATEALTDPMSLREAKMLLRAVLARHIGTKPLNAGRLFQARRVPASEEKHGSH
jgi:DNA repair protein RecO (recombination protein O)